MISFDLGVVRSKVKVTRADFFSIVSGLKLKGFSSWIDDTSHFVFFKDIFLSIMFFTITDIIIHTELLVAKIKSCIPKLCDKEGNIFLILPGQYFFNIARTLCDQSFPRIALCPAHLSYCCYIPQAFAFVR